MKAFSPEVTIDGFTMISKTYDEIKKTLPSLLLESHSKKATVIRYRRGTWGQWFEHWEYINNRACIVKQGWM